MDKNVNGSPARDWEWIFTALGLAFLVAASVKLLLDVEYMMDVGQTDEAVYLTQGFFLTRDGLPSPQWAPLYAIWYFLVSRVFALRDMVRLYDLNYVLLSSLVPVVFFLYLRRLRVHAVIALMSAVLVLISYPNLRVWPYPTKFAALLFFSVLAVSTFFHGRARFTVLLLGLLATSYVRPEYFVAFGLAAVLCLIYAARLVKRMGIPVLKSLAPHVAVIAACLIGAWLLLGNPSEGNRQLTAFKQHFSLNYVQWTGVELDPWRDANEITETVFGEFSSVGQAIQSNPQAFARHLASNAVSTWEVLARSIVAPFLPKQWASELIAARMTIVLGILLLLGLILSLWILSTRVRSTTSGSAAPGYLRLFESIAGSNRPAVQVLVLALVAVTPTILAATILVYPREHYYQILAMLLIACWAVVVSQAMGTYLKTRLSRSKQLLILAATGIVLLILMPNVARGWQLQGKPYHVRTDIRSTLELLQGLDRGAEVRFLTGATNRYAFTVYLADNFVKVNAFPKTSSFDQMMQDLDAIVWPEQIAQDPSYAHDDSYQSFVTDPAAYGFVKLVVPWSNDKASVLVRKDTTLFDLENAAQLVENSKLEAYSLGLSSELPAGLAAKKLRAEQLVQSGNLDEAIELLQELTELSPANRALQMQYAAVLNDNGDREQALREYRRISRQWPDTPWPLVRRAEILVETGDLAAAIREYEKAARLAPEVADIHFALARALMRVGRNQEAIREFEMGLELNPEREGERTTLESLRQQQ